ncbi:hypothetical protein KAS79_03855 [Candidatus Parcubacteria bacterium]|nr:hypothetical protein [Candidatus Parcubacteria bacterium]
MDTKQTQNLYTKQTRNFWFGVGLVFLLFSVGLAQPVRAEGASLYLSPSSGSFFIGSTFDVSIFVNTNGEDINAVEVNLKFDPTKLQVASPTAGKSFISVWISQPAYSNTEGTLSFMGGIPSPGINTSSGLVSTVTFRVLSPGETSIVFLDSSKVLRNDPDGTDILTSMGRGVYNLVVPPPEGPNVFSLTHSDKNRWYKNNNPTFGWEREEGAANFSYSFDQDPTGTPDNRAEGDYASVSYGEVEDGIWYFHVKVEKENVWGGTSHYLVQIDAGSPAGFTPTVEPSLKTSEKQPLVSFITTDALSGLDHYEIKYIDITKEKKEKPTGFFVEITTPYRLPSLEIGKYLIVVRAYDKAGNWKEGTVKLQIFPDGISLNKKGIQFKGVSFPWWILILILIIIIILIGYYLWTRHQKIMRRRKEQFKKMEEKFKHETEHETYEH